MMQSFDKFVCATCAMVFKVPSMFSLRRDYFSFCCTKVLFAEHRLFYDSFVSNHYTFFLIKSLVLQSRFREPMLSFIPPLVYLSAELCIPVPKESVSDTILY